MDKEDIKTQIAVTLYFIENIENEINKLYENKYYYESRLGYLEEKLEELNVEVIP